MSILLYNNLVATLGCLDRIGLLVEILELLEGTTLGLDTVIVSKVYFYFPSDYILGRLVVDIPKEIPKRGFDNVPAYEDPEIVRANILERNGRGELRDETGAADEEAGEGETLCARCGF